MKVVINRCYGGFGLSKKAVMRLHELGDKHVEEQTREEFFSTDSIDNTIEKQNKTLEMLELPSENGIILSEKHRSNNRDCPILIKMVEELGEESFGKDAELKVVQIPDGIEYTIEKYDGMEWVAEKHRT